MAKGGDNRARRQAEAVEATKDAVLKAIGKKLRQDTKEISKSANILVEYTVFICFTVRYRPVLCCQDNRIGPETQMRRDIPGFETGSTGGGTGN
ncbi:MAG: hypothetical protein ACR2PR_03605 [Pseudohongiellaceae bacterium]